MATRECEAHSFLSRKYLLSSFSTVEANLRRYVKATITLPDEHLGRVIELCEANRGEQKSLEFFHATQVILTYEIPTAQLVDDLFGKLKSAT